MLKIIRSLFLLCLINKYFTTAAAIYQFAASLDSTDLKIYNGQELQKTITLSGLSHSLDFDPDTKVLIGASLNKKVFTWNITQTTSIWSQEEEGETRAIAFLNKTHFIAGFRNFFVIYDCSNLGSKFKKTDSTNIGEVYDIKILHEEQKMLIASHEGFISVFNLININFLNKNQIAERIWAIDAFDKNLIVSQCQLNDVCLYKLNSSNDLIELKRCSGVNEFFTIKILNENKVVFGGDQFLKIWDISTNQIIKTISTDDKALSLDIFGNQIIASGFEINGVKFWNMTNYGNFITVNTGSRVHSLKNLNGYSAFINYLDLKSTQNSTEMAGSNVTTISFQSSLPEEIKRESTVQSTNEILMTSTASAFSQPTSFDELNSFPQTGSSSQFSSSKNLVFSKVLVNHKIPQSFNQFLIFSGFIQKIICFRKCLILSCHFVVYSDQLGQCQMFSFINSTSYFDQSQGYSVYNSLVDSY